MDQFTAHLDRGWDLVQRGDTRGAAASARQALEVQPQSPEAYNLLGFVAALDGDSFEAVEHYRQAVALDETYLEAMLNAAEVYIHPLGQFDDAIAMCEQALNLSETNEEAIDALLLTFDAMLGKGDLDGARAAVARLPEPPYEDTNHMFLIGRALYEIGEPEQASPLIDEVVRTTPDHGEAWYYRGMIQDERGEARNATLSFLRTRELDAAEPDLPWTCPREMFLQITTQARDTLDPAFRKFVSEADIFISDLPGVELVADGVDPRALLLLDGLASVENPGPPCSRIFVYQRNIERVAGSPDRIEWAIQESIEREVTAVFLESPIDRPQGREHYN